MRRHRSTRHTVPVLLGLPVLLVLAALLAAGCSSGGETTPASPVPPPTSAAAPGSTSAGPNLADTRTLAPARGLFSVAVPTRFVDVDANSPEATAVAPLAQAVRNGVGVLAVDRTSAQTSGSGYSPTAGGFCTRTPSQDLPQLAEELRAGAVATGTTTAPPMIEVLPATRDAEAARTVRDTVRMAG